MWARGLAVLCGSFALVAGAAAGAQPCPHPNALGVARVVEIDASSGPVFGGAAPNGGLQTLLRPKEVVLTFDDGPMPSVTQSILDTLDRFCIKATFFSVGKMAAAHPDMVKTVLARGHTLGSHSWSHPQPFSALPTEAARAEIDRGFAAVTQAAGRPIAPFFRFPGLRHTPNAHEYLKTRGIATFGVDVISDDSFITDPDRLARLVLQRVEMRQGGIILFHDIKHQSAIALPVVLAELKTRGYQVVHVVPKQTMGPVALSTVRPDPPKAKQDQAKQEPVRKQDLPRAKIIPVKKDGGADRALAGPASIGVNGIMVAPIIPGPAAGPSAPADTGGASGQPGSEPASEPSDETAVPAAAVEPEPDPNVPTAGRWSSAAPITDRAAPSAGRWSSTANRSEPPRTEMP